jgi:hypothetical protein
VSVSPEKNKEQDAYAALEELLRRAKLHRTTGSGYVRIDLKAGGVTTVRHSTEELFEPK